MLTTRRSVVLVSLALALAIGMISAAAVAPAVSMPKPKIRTAKLELDVAGYVETRRLKDTTSDCHPGETYVQTNRFEFETGHYVPTKLRNIGFPNSGRSVITSTFSEPVGSATVDGSISGYRTTNWCPPHPEDPDPIPPHCTKTHGKIAVALTPGGEGGGELADLLGKRLMLSIARRGGKSDHPSCVGSGAGRVKGVDGGRSVVSTSFAPVGVSEILTSDMHAYPVFHLNRRKRLRSAIVIAGPCRAVSVRATDPPGDSPNRGALNADGDCWLTGKVVLNVRAAR